MKKYDSTSIPRGVEIPTPLANLLEQYEHHYADVYHAFTLGTNDDLQHAVGRMIDKFGGPKCNR